MKDDIINDIMEATHGGKRLSVWEKNFIEDMQEVEKPTEAQMDKLIEIANEYVC